MKSNFIIINEEFSSILLLTVLIWVLKLNEHFFLVINSYHNLLPISIWKCLNFISYSKYFILPSLLIVITALYRKDKLKNVLFLIAVFYILFEALKILIAEARPYVVLPANSFYWLNLYESAKGSAYRSFPSGHTGNMAIFVFTLNRLFFSKIYSIKTLLLLLLVLTALARICTGWHWPLDVLVSSLISYLLVKFIIRI